MEKYGSGTKAGKGTYVNLSTGEFLVLASERDTLPDGATAKYLKVPIGLVFVAGPMIGLAYILFLPLAGLGSLLMLAVHRVMNGKLSPADRKSES
jgi:hypothetical protein